MGTIIKRNARVERIEEDIRMSLKVGTARGAAIAEAADEHLTAVVAMIDREVAQRKAALDAEEAARVTMMVEIERADRVVANIRDAMWNALGRPRHSLILDSVFPDGLATYTRTNPHDRPASMEVLQARLLSATVPVLTAEQRGDWAAQVEGLRGKLTEVVTVHQPLRVKADIADATYRSVVRAGLGGVHAFKHALLILGLSESQIHDIIPDSPQPRTAVATPRPGSQPTAQPGGGASPNAAEAGAAPVPPLRAAG